MKRNLTLFGVLVLLLVGTYIFQERRSLREFAESLTANQVISEDDLKSLTLGNFTAEKKDDRWWSGKTLLSHNKMKQVVRRMSQIRKVKTLEGDPKKFFTDPFYFHVNGEKWSLGDLTLDKQGFYLSTGKEIMVATIEGESNELTQDETKIAQTKVDELKRLLLHNLDQMEENQLFRFYPDLPSESVTIETDGNLSYELDFKKNSTVPPPIKGISPHENLYKKFTSVLTQMTTRKEVPFDKKLMFVKLGQMIFQGDGKKVTWELWLQGDNSADSYIVDKDQKRAWKMVGGTLRGFFLNVQDYWDKKVIPPSEFENFNELKVTFTQGSKKADVTIKNREPLAFESNKGKVKTDDMMALFQYIFNLGEKDQADRVSQLSSSERKEVLSGLHLRVDVLDQDLLFWRKKEELIVVNLTQGFKAHFGLVDESFRAAYEDVLN